MGLFFGVQVVVYVEGGKSNLSISELEDGSGHVDTVDVTFWRILFDYYRPRTKVHISSVGHKPTLLEIADLISSNRITNVYVAMDRDYDNHTDRQILCPGVIYTKGYSFENDVWVPIVVLEAFRALCPTQKNNTDIVTIVDRAFKQFHIDIARAIRVDVALAANGQGLIFGHSPEGLLLARKGTMPRLNVRMFRTKLSDRPKDCKCFCPTSPGNLNAHDDCHGKVAEAAGYRILLNVLYCYDKKASLSKKLAIGLALTAFKQCLRNGDCQGHSIHYKPQFARLPA